MSVNVTGNAMSSKEFHTFAQVKLDDVGANEGLNVGIEDTEGRIIGCKLLVGCGEIEGCGDGDSVGSSVGK